MTIRAQGGGVFCLRRAAGMHESYARMQVQYALECQASVPLSLAHTPTYGRASIFDEVLDSLTVSFRVPEACSCSAEPRACLLHQNACH